MWIEIAHSLQNGDRYIYWMMGICFLGTVILFERLIMLQFVYNINFGKYLSNLRKAVKAEDLDRAAALSKASGKMGLPLIALKAIEAAEADPTTVRGVIEEEALDFVPRIDTRLGVLPALASAILLVGVLGTINALWDAFHSIDVLDTAQKQAMIGHGIAGSLSYCALGLLISMLFLVGHQILRSMAISLTERFHHGITVVNNLLVPAEVAFVAMGAGAPAKESAPTPAAPPPAPVAAAPVEQEAPVDASLEQASVEDIKDEEEII